MKTYLVVFCLILLSFAVWAGVSQQSTINSQTFYKPIDSDPSYDVKTGLLFNNQLTVSTSSKVLSPSGASSSDLPDGAKICPGQVTLKTTASGSYAHGAWEANIYNQNPSSGNKESDYTSWGSKPFTSDLSIDFSSNIYNNLDISKSYIFSNDPLWTTWSASQLQKIDSVELYNFNTFQYFSVYNKAGLTGMICKAKINYNSGGSSQGSSYVESGTSSKSVSALTLGKYSFNSELNVEGCAIVIYPQGLNQPDQFKDLYSRTATSNGPEYKFTQQKTSNVNVYVSNPKFTASTSIYYPTGTVAMSKGDSVLVYIKVQNTGDVKFKPDSASIDSSTPGFSVSPGPANAIDPQNIFGPLIKNAYGNEISPGNSGIVVLSVTATSEVQKGSKFKINLQLSATEKTCKVLSGGQQFETTTTAFEIPTEPSNKLKSCEFVPKSKDVFIGDSASYDLFCYDDLLSSGTKKPVDCLSNGIKISVAPGSVAVLSKPPQALAGKTNVQVLSVGAGSASVSADNKVISPPVSCTASLNVKNLVPDACSLTALVPGCMEDNSLSQLQIYQMDCTKNGKAVPCPANDSQLGVSVPNGIATYTGYVGPTDPGQSGFVVVQDAKFGSSLVSVSDKIGGYSCSANICVMPSAGNFNSCLLSPASLNTNAGQSALINITCTELGKTVPCKVSKWESFGAKSSFVSTSNSNVKMAFDSPGTTTVTATVIATSGFPASYTCSAVAKVGPSLPSIFGNSCTITPNPAAAVQGNSTSFSVICYFVNGSVHTPVPCKNVHWVSNGLQGVTSIKQNDSNAVYSFANIGKGSVSAFVNYLNQNSYSCKSDVSVSAPAKEPEHGDACNITVKGPINLGEQFDAAITCYNTTSGNVVPCVGVKWALTGTNGGSPGTISGTNTSATCELNNDPKFAGAQIVAVVNDIKSYSCNYVIGATLTNQTNLTNKTPNTPNKLCSIKPAYWLAQPFQSMDVIAFCGEAKDKPCDKVDWPKSDLVSFKLVDPVNDAKRTVTVTSTTNFDQIFVVNAIFGGEDYSCNFRVISGPPTCVYYV